MPASLARRRRWPAGAGLWVLLCSASATASGADCQLTLSQAEVDYGLLQRAQLLRPPGLGLGASREVLDLGQRTLNLNLSCVEPRTLALRFNGVAAGPDGFRFSPWGIFRLTLEQARVDGQAVELQPLQRTGETVAGRLRPGQALVALVGGAPLKGRHFSAQVHIHTQLAAAATLVRDELELLGQGRFELISAPPSR